MWALAPGAREWSPVEISGSAPVSGLSGFGIVSAGEAIAVVYGGFPSLGSDPTGKTYTVSLTKNGNGVNARPIANTAAYEYTAEWVEFSARGHNPNPQTLTLKP